MLCPENRGDYREVPSDVTQFKRGQSGNPGGRPTGVAARARELVGDSPDRLLRVLLAVAEDERARPADRIVAAREYLDRGWGRAGAAADVSMVGAHGTALWSVTAVDQQIEALTAELASKS